MLAVGKTDVGNIRENNEDAFFASDGAVGALPNLFLIADGMGGHKAGEIASRSAIDFFLEYVNTNPCHDDELLDFITEAVRYANTGVYEKSIANEECSGMGTTFSVCVISNGKMYIAHIGDSRVYLLSDGIFRQMTNDHTYVGEMLRAGQFSKEEAERHPNKNALTRALGVEQHALVDARIDRVLPGDQLLLCSDGLSNMVSDAELNEIIQSGTDINVKAGLLIERAKAHGGMDNITAIIIEIEE